MRSVPSGILLIDKPAGMTSAKAVAIVKRLTRAKKAGHTGTLDPLATGLLICCLNQATRLARFLLTGEKTYEAVLHLGIRTDTQDATGQILTRQDWRQVAKSDVKKALTTFTGSSRQRPPAYSAIKHQGRPLYHWARQGKPVSKPARDINISSLDLQQVAMPMVHFRVTCSAGTYIRTLCADVGDILGCGGHLASLRRVASCGFEVTDALQLAQLETMTDSDSWKTRLILPTDALPVMPAIQANDTLKAKIRHGRALDISDGIPNQSEKMKIIDTDGNLLAIIDRNYRYCCVFPDGI